jgi:hypothetical protein
MEIQEALEELWRSLGIEPSGWGDPEPYVYPTVELKNVRYWEVYGENDPGYDEADYYQEIWYKGHHVGVRYPPDGALRYTRPPHKEQPEDRWYLWALNEVTFGFATMGGTELEHGRGPRRIWPWFKDQHGNFYH